MIARKAIQFVPVLIVAWAVLGPQTSWASRHKATQALETYDAVDTNPMESSASAIMVPAGQAAGVADRASPPSHGGVVSADAKAPAAAARWQTAPFDSVPAAQADSIAKRLGLVEQLLRRYGRAYDYRTLTAKDLEAILAYLDQESSRQEVSPQ